MIHATRRTFLAAAAAAAFAGATPLSAAWAEESAAGKTESVDLLIVGAGGAGLGAAIEAAEQSKAAGAPVKLLVIEKMPFPGGTTLLSSTAFNAGGAKVQKDYSAEDYLKKLQGGFPKADAHDVANMKELAELSGPTADWLSAMGADLSRAINGSQLTPKNGGALGAMLVPVMLKRAEALGIEIRTNTAAASLLLGDGGRVEGVHVKASKSRPAYDIRAKAVILAAGGFASNPELVKRFTPQWAGYPSTASAGAEGDGIVMAEKAGAKLDNMSLAGPQTVAYDTGHGAVSLTNVRYNGAILVNRDGHRFTNELGITAKIGADIKAQPGGVAYLIFDEKAVENASLMKTYREAGWFVEAPTLAALAEKLGVDGKALEETVKRWQGFYDRKRDDDFGRTQSMFSRIDQAPFYGQKISPASQTTYGGVERDLAGRVLRPDGSAIPGLYVAGETADQYGQGVSIAVVTGRIAARGALEDMKKAR